MRRFALAALLAASMLGCEALPRADIAVLADDAIGVAAIWSAAATTGVTRDQARRVDEMVDRLHRRAVLVKRGLESH